MGKVPDFGNCRNEEKRCRNLAPILPGFCKIKGYHQVFIENRPFSVKTTKNRFSIDFQTPLDFQSIFNRFLDRFFNRFSIDFSIGFGVKKRPRKSIENRSKNGVENRATFGVIWWELEITHSRGGSESNSIAIGPRFPIDFQSVFNRFSIDFRLTLIISIADWVKSTFPS